METRSQRKKNMSSKLGDHTYRICANQMSKAGEDRMCPFQDWLHQVRSLQGPLAHNHLTSCTSYHCGKQCSTGPLTGQFEVRQHRQGTIQDHLALLGGRRPEDRSFASYSGFLRILMPSHIAAKVSIKSDIVRPCLHQPQDACEHCCPEVCPSSHRLTSAVAYGQCSKNLG